MVNVRINSRVRRVGVDKELDKCDVGGARALFVPPVDSQTTQRGTQRRNRRMAAGSNGVLRMDGTWVGEAVVASDKNEQRSPRSALALHAL